MSAGTIAKEDHTESPDFISSARYNFFEAPN